MRLMKKMKKISLMKRKRHVIYVKKSCTNESNENYKNRKKVENHCHYTRKFIGAARSIFNLKYKVLKDIPIVIHNASYS